MVLHGARPRSAPLLAALLLVLGVLASACEDGGAPAAGSSIPASSTQAPAAESAAPAPTASEASSPPPSPPSPVPLPADAVAVPRIVPGTRVDEAVAQLRAAGLVPAPGAVSVSYQQRPVVVRTEPAAGARVPAGSVVHVALAAGPFTEPTCVAQDLRELPPTPQLVGRSLADATRALGYTRWLVAGGLPELAALPPDIAYLSAFTVTAQEPAGGEPQPICGAPVGLEVALAPIAGGAAVAPPPLSTGPTGGGTVRVPALPAYLSIDEAVALLRRRGLLARIPAIRGISFRRGALWVRGTEPGPGSRVRAGSAVRLRLRPLPPDGRRRCSPARVVMPDVVALDLADAAAALDVAGVPWRVERLPALAPDQYGSGLLASYVVIGQEPRPSPSTVARCGPAVRLDVRAAPGVGLALVPRIPPLTSVQRAARLVARAGLAATVGPGFASALARPSVKGTRPQALRVLGRGSRVELAIGGGPLGSPTCSGPPDAEAPAPALVGLDLAAAADALDALTIGWDVAGRLPPLAAPSPDLPYLAAFVVTAQSPAAGAKVRRCQTPQVHLMVAVAPAR